MLGKNTADCFCFLPPPFISPTLKIVILFLFSAASSSPIPENCQRIVSFVFLVQCLFFFCDMVFPFAFYLEQHPIVCPLKFRIKGCFSLSYCPLISLKHVSSWYHRTCRIAWHLIEFKVMLVYKRHCLLSLV